MGMLGRLPNGSCNPCSVRRPGEYIDAEWYKPDPVSGSFTAREPEGEPPCEWGNTCVCRDGEVPGSVGENPKLCARDLWFLARDSADDGEDKVGGVEKLEAEVDVGCNVEEVAVWTLADNVRVSEYKDVTTALGSKALRPAWNRLWSSAGQSGRSTVISSESCSASILAASSSSRAFLD